MRVEFIAIFLIVFNSCRKDEGSRLPPITSNGANTAGVIINGENWKAEPFTCGPPGGGFSLNVKEIGWFNYYSQQKLLKLDIRACEKNKLDHFSLQIANYKGPGKYICSEGGFVNSLPNYSIDPKNYIEFWTSPLNGSLGKHYVSGYGVVAAITITKLDTLSKPAFVSGTFEGKLQEVIDKNDTIRLISGRFDVINDK